MNKKGAELSLNFLIIAALALIVLILVVLFFTGGFENEEGYETCTKEEPFCYEEDVGCSSAGPDKTIMIQKCKAILGKDFEQAAVCEVDDKGKVLNPPCTCPDKTDQGLLYNEYTGLYEEYAQEHYSRKLMSNDEIKIFIQEEIINKNKRRVPMKTCLEEQYCDFGENGCADE